MCCQNILRSFYLLLFLINENDETYIFKLPLIMLTNHRIKLLNFFYQIRKCMKILGMDKNIELSSGYDKS